MLRSAPARRGRERDLGSAEPEPGHLRVREQRGETQQVCEGCAGGRHDDVGGGEGAGVGGTRAVMQDVWAGREVGREVGRIALG
jgi:hypothetical protein